MRQHFEFLSKSVLLFTRRSRRHSHARGFLYITIYTIRFVTRRMLFWHYCSSLLITFIVQLTLWLLFSQMRTVYSPAGALLTYIGQPCAA